MISTAAKTATLVVFPQVIKRFSVLLKMLMRVIVVASCRVTAILESAG
jgi:hypothetical protein